MVLAVWLISRGFMPSSVATLQLAGEVGR
jgi:hypothetical protein